MAFESPGFTWTYPAAADYSAEANQYKFVKLNTSGEAEICSATTDEAFGILQNRPNPAVGQLAEVMHLGISKVRGDAALTVGANVGTSADGQAAIYVHGTDTTKYIVGKVIGACGAAGELGTVLLSGLMAGRAA